MRATVRFKIIFSTDLSRISGQEGERRKERERESVGRTEHSGIHQFHLILTPNMRTMLTNDTNDDDDEDEDEDAPLEVGLWSPPALSTRMAAKHLL